MLNNRIGLTGLLLLGSIAGFAQTSVVVKEAKSNVTLPGAHVVFYAPNSKDSVALQTDVSGKAELPSNWASGDKKWSYRASFVGYQTQHDTLKSGDKSVIYLLPSLENLGEVVVTAQYEPGSSEDAVHVVRVIDREKIDHMAAVSLDDVLSNALNIRLSQDNVLGSRMSMQGISGRNVKILVDGIPMIGRQDGNLDLSQINLQDIERIEVVEGPLSVNFGTDALAGTINLITRKGGREKIGIRSTTYQETIGTYNQNLSVNFNHKNLFARVSGTRNFFDGWNPGDDHMFSPPERSADETRVQQWKPREQWLGSALVGWRGTTSEVSYQFRYFEETIKNRGFPRPPYGESAFDDQYITRRTDHGINYKTTITDNIRFSAVAGYNHYEREKNTFLTDLTTLGQSLSAAEGSQDTSVFELWMSRGSAVFGADSSKIKWELGYDAQYETSAGRRIEGRTQELGDYALFVTSEIQPFDGMVLRPGLRAAYNTDYDAPLLPSFNVRYRLNKWVIRGSYARGYRAPSLKELYFFFVDINHNIRGNTDLKSESSHNYTANLQRNFLLNKNLFKIELGGFYNKIDNLITLAQGEGTLFTYVNIGEYQTRGLRMNGSWMRAGWNVQSGLTYTGQYNAISEAFSVDRFSYYPEANLNLTKTILKTGTVISIFYKYQGELPGFRQTAEDQVEPSFIEAYHTADMTVTQRFWKQRIGISAGAKNLFDVQNVAAGLSGGVHSSNASSVPVSTGRFYFLKLDLQWLKN